MIRVRNIKNGKEGTLVRAEGSRIFVRYDNKKKGKAVVAGNLSNFEFLRPEPAEVPAGTVQAGCARCGKVVSECYVSVVHAGIPFLILCPDCHEQSGAHVWREFKALTIRDTGSYEPLYRDVMMMFPHKSETKLGAEIEELLAGPDFRQTESRKPQQFLSADKDDSFIVGISWKTGWEYMEQTALFPKIELDYSFLSRDGELLMKKLSDPRITMREFARFYDAVCRRGTLEITDIGVISGRIRERWSGFGYYIMHSLIDKKEPEEKQEQLYGYTENHAGERTEGKAHSREDRVFGISDQGNPVGTEPYDRKSRTENTRGSGNTCAAQI